MCCIYSLPLIISGHIHVNSNTIAHEMDYNLYSTVCERGKPTVCTPTLWALENHSKCTSVIYYCNMKCSRYYYFKTFYRVCNCVERIKPLPLVTGSGYYQNMAEFRCNSMAVCVALMVHVSTTSLPGVQITGNISVLN